MANSITDKFKVGKASNLSVADLERLDYAGSPLFSLTDLAAVLCFKANNQSMADRYWTRLFAGSNLSLADKSIQNASSNRAYSDTMFVAGQ